MAERLLCSINGVAEALDVSRKKTYELRATDPRFPVGIPLGPRVTKYDLDDVRAYVAALKADAKTKDKTPQPERLALGRASYWELPPDQREARRAEKAAQRAARATRNAARLAALAGGAEPRAGTAQPVRAMAEQSSALPERVAA